MLMVRPKIVKVLLNFPNFIKILYIGYKICDSIWPVELNSVGLQVIYKTMNGLAMFLICYWCVLCL